MTLGESKARHARVGDCKCTYNPRTGKTARLCFVGKSAKSRSGWAFSKGAADHCKR